MQVLMVPKSSGLLGQHANCRPGRLGRRTVIKVANPSGLVPVVRPRLGRKAGALLDPGDCGGSSPGCPPGPGGPRGAGAGLDRSTGGSPRDPEGGDQSRPQSRVRSPTRQVARGELGGRCPGFLAHHPQRGSSLPTRTPSKAFSDIPLAKPLLDYRRVSHRLTTWAQTYQRHLTPDGRIRPGFLLLGARAGRMSCRTPNIQNLPRDSALRACFVAPEGFRIMAADYGQIELRTAGLLSGDPVIRAAYEGGHDLHREIVARITGRPLDTITEAERKLGKALNFGLLYGAGSHDLPAQGPDGQRSRPLPGGGRTVQAGL